MDNNKIKVQCLTHKQKIQFISVKNKQENQNLFACFECLRARDDILPFIHFKEILETPEQQLLKISDFFINKNDSKDISKEFTTQYAKMEQEILNLKQFFKELNKQIIESLEKVKIESIQKYQVCQDIYQKGIALLAEMEQFYNASSFRISIKSKIKNLKENNQIEISNELKQYFSAQDIIYQQKLSDVQQVSKQFEEELKKISIEEIKKNVKQILSSQLVDGSFWSGFKMKHNYAFVKQSNFAQSNSIIEEPNQFFKNVQIYLYQIVNVVLQQQKIFKKLYQDNQNKLLLVISHSLLVYILLWYKFIRNQDVHYILAYATKNNLITHTLF